MRRNLSIPENIGKRFHRLVVQEIIKGGHDTKWRCLCDCGAIVTSAASAVRRGNTRSCGCLQAENRTKHGLSPRGPQSPEYKAWRGLRRRCLNPHFKQFADYGGRGITVCERWNDFAAFLADMGKRPSPQHQLDRINNNGNYEPTNCRWATHAEQMRNTRRTVNITFHGTTKCVADWAKEIGMSHPVLMNRLKHWSVEQALTLPKHSKPLSNKA